MYRAGLTRGTFTHRNTVTSKGVLQEKADVPFLGSLSRARMVTFFVTTCIETIQKVVVDKWYISSVMERHKITIFLLTQHIF